MKVVIPVAGYGKRLRPLTYAVPKALIHVAGRPMLFHVLERVCRLKPSEIVLVRSPFQQEVEEAVQGYEGAAVRCVVQEEPLGLGHAVWCGGRGLEAKEVVILLGDTIFDADIESAIARGCGMIGVRQVEDPRRFGVVRVEGGRIREMVEKPDEAVSRLAIVGIYYVPFFDRLWEALDRMIKGGERRKGEFQITDALNALCKEERFEPFEVAGWYDCGTIEALLETNRRLLDGELGGGAKSAVPAGADVEESEIGPYVSLGEGCTVRGSRLRNCVLHEEVRVEGCDLHDSLVGARSTLRGVRGKVIAADDSRLEGA